ncbi:hypothetical protein GCM10023192_81360 [Amycolatopsis samaneae]
MQTKSRERSTITGDALLHAETLKTLKPDFAEVRLRRDARPSAPGYRQPVESVHERGVLVLRTGFRIGFGRGSLGKCAPGFLGRSGEFRRRRLC